MTSRLALAAVLTIALAACGSGGSDDAVEEDTAVADAGVATGADQPEEPDAAAEADESPDVEPTAAPSASPTPTPASTPTQKAAPVAAAGPPDSFKQCSICHKTEPGQNTLGPSLANVFGARAGQAPGFKYSQAMVDSGLVWNQANLDRFLADPKAVVPNTTMAFAGVKDAGKRAEIIAYLKTL